MACVEIESLYKTFSTRDRVTAVREVSLSVAAGELVAILGPSGCGKSTLLRCLAGLERPDSGRIVIDGVTVYAPDRWVAPEERGIGMVFQSYALWPHMTVRENLSFPLKMSRRPAAETRAAVARSLGIVGLTGMEDRFPSQLSGGQQQRVALARAIIANPKVLLFDEPLSNLDAKLRETMRLELRELQQRLGWTALYVTHDRSEAMYLADRVVVLKDGHVQQVGGGPELYHRPVNAFVAEFLGDINFVPAVPGPDGQWRPDASGVAAAAAADPDAPARPAGPCFGLRPEWIRLIPAGDGAGAVAVGGGVPPRGVLGGRVRTVTHLGWFMEYVVEAGTLTLKVRGPVDNPLPAGADALVAIDLDRALLFAGPDAPI